MWFNDFTRQVCDKAFSQSVELNEHIARESIREKNVQVFSV